MQKIYIQNDITKATLKKLYKILMINNNWWCESLDNHSDMNQYLENIENGYITLDALKRIVFDLFKQDKKGGFRDCLSYYETRSKKRWLHDRFNDLLPEEQRDIYLVK